MKNNTHHQTQHTWGFGRLNRYLAVTALLGFTPWAAAADLSGGTTYDAASCNSLNECYVGTYTNGPGQESTGGNVFMSGGVIPGGGTSDIYGGYSANGGASHNTVTISGGQITTNGSAYGGRAHNGDATYNTLIFTGNASNNYNLVGGRSDTGNASHNTVNISGGTSSGSIIGGYTTGAGNANDNRVILSGSPVLKNATLYGGFNNGVGSGDIRTGNVLEIRTLGLTAVNAVNFDEYDFYLPANTTNATVLTLTDGAHSSFDDAKIGVAVQTGGGLLETGDRVTLVAADNTPFNTSGISQTALTGDQGISLQYRFGLSTDAKHIYATVLDRSVREQTKAPVEGQAAAMAMSLQGSDLISGTGMDNAMAATQGSGTAQSFGAISGTSSRYNTGSHIDTHGASVLLGVAKRFAQAPGASWLAGVFLEGGWGRYDSYNAFDNGQIVHGDGNSRYVGGGVLVRRDWTWAGHGHPYVEGSLHAGNTSTDWASNDMIGTNRASYDTSSPYYGAHLGLGYVQPLTERLSLDLSAKYFWTHLQGDSTTIADDPFRFDAIDSHRTRLGARLNRVINDRITAYVSGAWDHEFDGKARATTYGLDTPSPNLKGDTGVFGVGFDMKPKAASALTVSLEAQAYTGVRQGFSGAAKAKWVF